MPDHKPDSLDDLEAQTGRLVREHGAYLRRLAQSILVDAAEADDATQETLIAACRGLKDFRGEAQMRTWLTRIAVNVCRSRLRRRRVRQVLQETLQSLHIVSSPKPSPEEAAIQGEADRRLWQAVDALDEKHRLPVILRYVQELSVPEIAGILGINEGTVHSRLHYARLKLQAQLETQTGSPLGSPIPSMEEMPS